jgi:hypothetical protein
MGHKFLVPTCHAPVSPAILLACESGIAKPEFHLAVMTIIEQLVVLLRLNQSFLNFDQVLIPLLQLSIHYQLPHLARNIGVD